MQINYLDLSQDLSASGACSVLLLQRKSENTQNSEVNQ